MITRKTWVLIFILVVIGLIALLFAMYYSTRQFDAGIKEAIESNHITAQKPSKLKSAVPANPVAPSAEDYTKLVAQYEGRRIQFDINCQAIPSNASYRSGTQIMFDNRSGDARYITIGGVSHYLAGYGYKILTLTSSELPKTVLISCGAAVNVGQILLQN